MSQRSLELFARLAVHFPSLGGNDSSARIRAEDWERVIDKSNYDNAVEAIQGLIEGWQGMGSPKIGDFQEACRRIAAHKAIPSAGELESGGEILPDPKRLAELLEQARQALTKRSAA